MVDDARIEVCNDRPPRTGGLYVLYWMQQAQRATANQALNLAVGLANRHGLPVVVCFGLTDAFPEANARHYAFMLAGLRETATTLAGRGIQMVIRAGDPPAVAIELAAEAAIVVMDTGYLRLQRDWRQQVGAAVDCQALQVEADVVVPVRVASDHQEIAARTLRPKIHRQLSRFLVPEPDIDVRCPATGLTFDGLSPDRLMAWLAAAAVDLSVPVVRTLRPGTQGARETLTIFIRDKLPLYASKRSEPVLAIQSEMSPYLHFGQISPVEVALRVRQADHAPVEARDAYLEELIVRRELSMNMVMFNPQYDAYDGLPEWARKSLAEHALDRREEHYTPADQEAGRTADPYWNAAQLEMVHTGKMHNYMRMYWGKRLLEWGRTPQEAFQLALRLNNKYELDGRDPNGFAGVAWCFGMHDHGWPERPIFGKVRCMKPSGLVRKFDIDAYVEKVAAYGVRNRGQ